MQQITNIGLQFITLNQHYIFKTTDFEIDENNTICFYTNEVSSIMGEFFTVFCKDLIVDNEEKYYKIQIESYMIFNDEIKNRLSNFINEYRVQYPKLNALDKIFKNVKLGEHFCVLPSWFHISTEVFLELKERVNKLNNVPNSGIKAFFAPVTQNYNIKHFEGCSNQKIGHKNKKERICRWCEKNYKETTFKEEAHAISEALGNKNLILFDECDKCNHKFAEGIESDIIKYFSFFNTNYGVKGKDGIPKIKTKEIKIEKINNENNLNIGTQNSTIEDNKPSSITFSQGKINQQNIYRAFCKFALSLIDEDVFKQYKWTVDWINNKEQIEKLPIVKRLFTYKFFSLVPTMQLYVRKNDKNSIPNLFVIFYHTCNVYLFIVPMNKSEIEKFTNEKTYNEFINTIPYMKNENWQDVDFSDNIPRDLQMTLNFVQKQNNSFKNTP